MSVQRKTGAEKTEWVPSYRRWCCSEWGKSACRGHLSWAGCHQMWNKPGLGPPQQLPASGEELEWNKSHESKCHENRILFIIPGIITDSVLLTLLATSDPGVTGQLMAKAKPTSPVEAELKTCALQQFSSPSLFQSIKADSQLESSIWMTKLFPRGVPLSREGVPIESCALSLLIDNMHDVFL